MNPEVEETKEDKQPENKSNSAKPKKKGNSTQNILLLGKLPFFNPAYATGTNCLLKLRNVKLKTVLEKR